MRTGNRRSDFPTDAAASARRAGRPGRDPEPLFHARRANVGVAPTAVTPRTVAATAPSGRRAGRRAVRLRPGRPRRRPAGDLAAGGRLTRHGLEEYVSDCVILLDHRVTEQVSTRRMRVVKYRGSATAPTSSRSLSMRTASRLSRSRRAGSTTRPPTRGFDRGPRPGRDVRRQGLPRGSSVLVSGTAGTGKSSLAAHFAAASCGRDERCLFSPSRSAGPARPEPPFRWARPGPLGQGGVAPHPFLPAHPVRVGDAPGDDAQAGHRVPAGRGDRPDQQLDRGGNHDRGRGHARSDGRLPQGPGDHHPVHKPDQRRCRRVQPSSAANRTTFESAMASVKQPGWRTRTAP